MAYADPVETYTGKIREVTIGPEGAQVTVGGETTLPYYLFEGEMPHKPAIAMEVYDAELEGWPPALTDALGDVLTDPVAWAKKCEAEWQADLICLQLASTDPTGADTSPEDAANLAKSVAEAVGIPVVVYGTRTAEKDAEVLKKVAEVCEGKVLVIGPATEDNYKPVTAAALGYKHKVAAETPIDVNMAKQLNILVTQLGLAPENIIIDPSTGALGYGLEYTYTVMERLRLAALTQNDDMTQMPTICNLAREAWRSKEAKTSKDEEPTWGDAAKRGVIWEAMTALALALAGADILIMRHPESVALTRKALAGLEQQDV